MGIRIHTEKDHGYSPDVEIDHDGVVKAAHDIEEGDTIQVPLHLFKRIVEQSKT